jgi:argininosuccinate lyase
LNRFASDLILFNTSEYGFVDLPDAFCTGSSIMPQKKNPDVLELIRANYHRLIAEMQVLLTLPANLPSGYHRDLQLTKEAVMRSLLLTDDLVTATLNLLPGIAFNEEAMRAATSPELFATSNALEKVLAGIPFRDAYRQAAAELDANEALDVSKALEAYQVEGFPGRENPEQVRNTLDGYRVWVEEHWMQISP